MQNAHGQRIEQVAHLLRLHADGNAVGMALLCDYVTTACSVTQKCSDGPVSCQGVHVGAMRRADHLDRVPQHAIIHSADRMQKCIGEQSMEGRQSAVHLSQRQARVAVVGQPGAGTTTVFDLLARSSPHSDTWPGTLIERRTATLTLGDVGLQLVELPSVPSLTSASPEELLVRDYLIKQRPDAVIAIVDATRLERGLYLVAELVGLTDALVVVLNMMDVAHRQRVEIDVDRLQAMLGLPVVPIVATRNQGVMDAAEAAAATLSTPERRIPTRPEVRQDHQLVLSRLHSLIAPSVPEPYSPDWVALKLLEGDEEITALMQGHLAERWPPVHSILMQHDDAALAIAGGRYEWIRRAVQPSVRQPLVGPSFTHRPD